MHAPVAIERENNSKKCRMQKQSVGKRYRDTGFAADSKSEMQLLLCL